MTDKPGVHPGKDELVAFGLGKLEPDAALKIETHLAECDACCETLLNLKDDTFVELVRRTPAPKQPMEAVDNDVGPEFTDAADGIATGDSIAAKTMPMTSGVSRSSADSPAQLEDHPRYRIIELIGKGGMGTVYKARHRLMDRLVALKLINQDLVKNTQAVDRFRREVRAAANLKHPNIVTAYDAEQAGDIHFLVMEFVDGTDLSSVVRQQGQLPIGHACDCIRQAAEGLQHAHEKGMVHRDIKPHNLMLNSDGQVRILDFGLAGFAAAFAAESARLEAESAADNHVSERVPLQLTTIGSVIGTPDYIAPEQARDAHSADIRADIYSLGCTLHYLLASKPPFEADSVLNTLKAHAEAARPKLSDARDDAPPELQSILDRMLAVEPEDRFQTPAEVATALESAMKDVQPATSAPKDQAGSSLRGKPRPLVLTTIAPLFLTAVAAVVFYMLTNNGVVRVEVTDPSLHVTISDQTITMDKNNKPLIVRVGDHSLIVRHDGSDFELTTDKFEVTRNGKVAIKVELLDDEVVVSRNGIHFQSEPLPKTRPTKFYRALDEARLASLVRSIAEDEKDGTIVGGWTAQPPYSIRETTWIDDIDARIIRLVYTRLHELAGHHGLTIEGSKQQELKMMRFDYSTAVRAGEVVLTLASRDAAHLPLVQARRVALSVEINEWPKGERTQKNEFRMVVYDRKDSWIAEISGPGIRQAGDLNLMTKELRPLIAKCVEPVVVLAACRGERSTSEGTAMLLKSVQKVLVDAGAVVKLDPQLSFPTMAVIERPDSPANRRTARLNRLSQVGIGLQNYHSFKNSFPPAKQNPDAFDDDGRPHLSWRVHILPYIAQEELFARFRLDEPWDSQHNLPLLDQMPDIYKTTDDPTRTTVLAVVGEGTAYEGKSGLKIQEIEWGDGLKQTAYAVDAGRERAVPWTKPEDLPFDKEDPIRAIGISDFGDQFLVLMADASVRSVPYDTAPESLRALFTRAAGDTFAETAKRTTPAPVP